MYRDYREDIELYKIASGRPKRILQRRLERRYGTIERALEASSVKDPISFMSFLGDTELARWYASEGIEPITDEMREPIENVINNAHEKIRKLSLLGFKSKEMLSLDITKEDNMKKLARMLRDEGARHLRSSGEFRDIADSLEFHAERIRLDRVYTDSKMVYNIGKGEYL